MPWFLSSGWGRRYESTMDGPPCASEADLGPDYSGAVMHGLYLGMGTQPGQVVCGAS